MACKCSKWCIQNRLNLLRGGAAVIFGFALFARAHEETLFALTLEQLMDIRVSGVTQVESEMLWSPASLNIFDYRALQLLNVDTLQQLAPLAPGFHVARSDDDNLFSLSVRGRRIGSSGREVLVLLDGMRIDNWYSGGGTFTMPNISLYNLKKVEFIRGAVSQLYGSNAFTGVINLESDPSLTRTRFTLGNSDLYRVQSTLTGKVNRLQHSLFMDIKSDGGAKYNVPASGSDDRVTLNDGSQALAGYYQAHLGDWSARALYSRYESDNYYVVGNYSPDFSNTKRSFYNVSLQHKRQWNAAFGSDLQAGQRYFEYLIDGEFAPHGALEGISQPSSALPLWIRVRENQETEQWLNWKNYFDVNDHFNLLLGVEWRNIDKSPVGTLANYDMAALANGEFPIASSSDLSIANPAAYKGSDRLLGLYLQSIYRLGQSNEITFGLRRDESDISGRQTTPRVAWVHTVTPDFALKAIYGEAFRMPVANELFLENNPVLLGNPELKAETVKTSEVIAFFEKTRSRIQLGVFESRYSNPIGQQSNGLIREFTNLPGSRSAGIEGNMSYQFNDRWIGRVNFSHLTNKPDDQYRIPDNLGGLVLSYQRAALFWSYQAQFVGGRESNPPASSTPVSLASYWYIISV